MNTKCQHWTWNRQANDSTAQALHATGQEDTPTCRKGRLCCWFMQPVVPVTDKTSFLIDTKCQNEVAKINCDVTWEAMLPWYPNLLPARERELLLESGHGRGAGSACYALPAGLDVAAFGSSSLLCSRESTNRQDRDRGWRKYRAWPINCHIRCLKRSEGLSVPFAQHGKRRFKFNETYGD